MKEIQKVMITVLLACSCVIGLAAADPVMTVSQQPTDIELGNTFTVNVTVDPMGYAIYAAQYDLYFDNNILSATDQTRGAFLSQDGATTFESQNKINNTIGKIMYGETILTGENGVTTPGILASITFEVIGDGGTSDLKLENVVLSDPDLKEIGDNEAEDEPPDDGEPEHYDALEEPDNHESSGSSNFAAAPTATTESSTATDDKVDSDSTPPTAEAEVIPTTEPTATATEAAPPNAPAQPESKAPGFEAASLIVVLLYLIKRR